VIWTVSHKYDPEARALADRHYSRQKVGARQFVPPGRALVLKSVDRSAYWVTSWPFAEYVRHEWAGAWVCSAFRNEGARDEAGRLLLASEMIRAAVACTLARWPTPPRVAAGSSDVAIVTFVDPSKVRRSRTPGRCFLKAGFRVIGSTKKAGLLALGLDVDSLPEPQQLSGEQAEINFAAVGA
jgi:hypothetical protein